MVKILDSGSSTTTRAIYGYDQQGQLTSATVGGTRYTYTYDTAGNIQSKKVGSTTTNYTYGNSAWRDLLTAYNGGSITYSGGNPTKYYDGSTFTWTQGRRLATAKVGSTNISYTYDMAGVRSSKTVGSTTYDFTTLSGLVTRQTGGGKTIDFVYDENNQPLAMKYNNTLYYYVLNAQGDVVRIVNSSRSVVASYTYDPWGKIISSSGTLADINPLRYRGYYYDSETGFYYLQSRYYDPEIGRFINADSYASTDATGLLSTNMFAYCENDPVNKSDPSGEWFFTSGRYRSCNRCSIIFGRLRNIRGRSYLERRRRTCTNRSNYRSCLWRRIENSWQSSVKSCWRSKGSKIHNRNAQCSWKNGRTIVRHSQKYD